MDMLFLGLALGCCGFLAKIILDYVHEIPVWQAKIEEAEMARDRYLSQMQGFSEDKEAVASKSQAMDEEIKTLEQTRDELRAEIETTKKELARKGRIIMRRKTDDSSQS